MLPQKRPQLESSRGQPKLSKYELKVCEVIKSKVGAGIWTEDVKKAALGLSQHIIDNAINSLKTKNLIKVVPSAKHKNQKIVMGMEFEPSDEISGGTWYQEGTLDVSFIKILREQCRKYIQKFKAATCEKIREAIRASSVFKSDITLLQISQIVELMVLDNEIEEVRSTGKGDFSHVPVGEECYRIPKSRPKGSAFSSIPCGVCPRISECTPEGVISPINCVYYNKWLDIGFWKME